ncbi:MAG: fibronectin type III domain-containing protein [Candidatus Hodarchaeota archaeon]
MSLPVEGIMNGGFETGDLSPWETGPPYYAWVHDLDMTYVTHSGSYGCQIMVYSGGSYRLSYVEQNLTGAFIYSDYVQNFTFWKKTLPNMRATITYWDNTTTTQDFAGNAAWTQHSVTNISPGKRLRKVRLETLANSSTKGGLDDISLLYTPVNGISNGGFEMGNLTDWTTGGTYLAWVHDLDPVYVTHSGSFGCQIMVFGGGTYHASYIEQNFTNSFIYSDFVLSFTFWKRTLPAMRVNITYWDNTSTYQDFSGVGAWVEHTVTNISAGKRLRKVRFEALSDSGTKGGIDDIELYYIPPMDIEMEGISNGGFELGDLTKWETGPPYYAWVHDLDMTYVTHSGSYGCQIMVYGGGTYRASYVEQNLTDKYIYSDMVNSFTFWKWTLPNMRVTVTYWDNTTTTQDFAGNAAWTQHTVTNLSPGKRLRKVRLETLSDSGTKGGLDDISLKYNFTLALPNATVLSTIIPNPDSNGNITLDWSEVPFADNYTVYRNSTPITEINASLTTLGTTIITTYTDENLTEGTYYYVVVAHNQLGDSSISNCESVLVDLPAPGAPVLAVITPNPDGDGNIALDWGDVTGADNYTVYRSSLLITVLNGTESNLGTVSSSNSTDLALGEGTYYYVVTATNTTGTSGISNCESVLVDIPAPAAPVLVAITPNPDGDGDIALDWGDVTGADNYTVYRSSLLITVLNGTESNLGTTSSSDYSDLGLMDGTYYYAVTATNTTGTSGISNCESVLVDIPGPSAPVLNPIAPNPDTDGDINLNWSDVSNADNYLVYRSTSLITVIDGSVTLIDNVTVSSCTDEGLVDGTYYYVIVAQNLTGVSPISNCVNVGVTIDQPVTDVPGFPASIVLMTTVMVVALILVQQRRKFRRSD